MAGPTSREVKVIGVYPYSASQDIRASIMEFNGNVGMDFRKVLKSGQPVRGGLFIRQEDFLKIAGDLKDAIDIAAEYFQTEAVEA